MDLENQSKESSHRISKPQKKSPEKSHPKIINVGKSISKIPVKNSMNSSKIHSFEEALDAALSPMKSSKFSESKIGLSRPVGNSCGGEARARASPVKVNHSVSSTAVRLDSKVDMQLDTKLDCKVEINEDRTLDNKVDKKLDNKVDSKVDVV